MLDKNKKKNIIITSVAATLIVGVIVGLIIGIVSIVAAKNNKLYTYAYGNHTQVGYSAEVLGTVKRYKPVAGISNGGLTYPTYGTTLNLTTEEKEAILAENQKLNAKATSTSGAYDWMDENGKLYVGNRTNYTQPDNGVTQLYKHSAALGMYLGDVDAQEPGIVKRLTFRPRSYNDYYNVTGLYAPAGEVIKVQISEADMPKDGGITIHIGQALYNGQSNNIWEARDFNRMPHILNTMNISPNTAVLKDGVYTAYVGSFLGGPIYVRSQSKTFSVTISGGVHYAHFILGVTTEKEYAKYAASSAPYFDLEVWDSGVLHSGPKTYAASFDYDELYKAAVLWEKISLVSTRVVNQGVVFLYDPFIAAGAAVAFPGRRSVNCPMDWMTSSLDYDSFVTAGAWGNVHEYHHNFQNYGVGDTGEVTNNALNLVSYSLFTKISSARRIASYGSAGLSGWNCYTSATWALNRVNSEQITSTNGLAVYATLLHNFGQDAFINTTGASGANYFNKWANFTHQDFSYYASQITAYTGSAVTSAATDYPTFVPVSCVYQTGRSYLYDNEKRDIQTMQPFNINPGQPFIVDLNPYQINDKNQYVGGSIVIGNGFTYNIKKVDASGISGTFQKSSNKNIYIYTPGSQVRSGKIRVTLEITTTSGSHTYNGKPLNDVDLILEFAQSHEDDKAMLERISYIYAEGNVPTGDYGAQTAYASGYQGSVETIVEDNINYTQNSNTDIWLYEPNNKPSDASDVVLRKPNSVVEIRGKIYLPENGKYRIAIRGRSTSSALYLSFDGGKTYQAKPSAYLLPGDNISTNPSNPKFSLAESRYYCDVERKSTANRWVYFKLVSIPVQSYYVGLGFARWQIPLYHQKLNANGDPVLDSKHHPIYIDSNGNEVSSEVANNAKPIAPTDKEINYLAAYRQNYEFLQEFTSDYFYTRTYNYNYEENTILTEKYQQTYLAEISNYVPWDNDGTQEPGNLFDGNRSTKIHTQEKVFVTPETPAILAFDMGQVVTGNTLKLYRSANNDAGNRAFPQVLLLEGSRDRNTWFTMGSWNDLTGATANGVELTFDSATFRYWKITVSKTNDNTGRSFFALSGLELAYVYRLLGTGDNQISPDNAMFTYKGSWRTQATDASFGHVYVGNQDATLTFQFDGTQFAILSAKLFGKKFKVTIDGKQLDSLPLKTDDSNFAVSYISPKLSSGKHTVVIKCTGKANIDSIAIYR